jgi:hypothetical protein
VRRKFNRVDLDRKAMREIADSAGNQINAIQLEANRFTSSCHLGIEDLFYS